MTHDPVNPPHYDGRECADIGERLTANGYQVLKYVWRLGRKDAAIVELGKAAWYADSECKLFANLAAAGIPMRTAPLVFDLADPAAFFHDRISKQPEFTQTIARMLWHGYNLDGIQIIFDLITVERTCYERT